MLVGVVMGLLLLAGIFVHAQTPSAGILNHTANVRDSAGMSAVVVVLIKNTQVAILGETEDWYQVSHPIGVQGWIAKWVVDADAGGIMNNESQITNNSTSTNTQVAIPVAHNTIFVVGVLTNNSNIRNSPDILPGNIVEVLPLGTTVQTQKTEGGWNFISYGARKTGWVAGWLVSTTVSNQQSALNEGQTQNTTYEIQNTNSSSSLPSSVSATDINSYWAASINALRKAAGVREVVPDTRLQGTAMKWATYLGQTGQVTHTRSDGKTMHQWIADQGIPFTERNSPNGWTKNYFTENIGVRYNVPPTSDGIRQTLDSILLSYLAEDPATGAHYQSMYHPDWNSVGVGWHLSPNTDGTVTAYFVFHYGSLQNN